MELVYGLYPGFADRYHIRAIAQVPVGHLISRASGDRFAALRRAMAYMHRRVSFVSLGGNMVGEKEPRNASLRRFVEGSTGHAIRLGLFLYCLWLLLSGYYLFLLLSLGLVSVLLTVVIAVRMDIVDHETYPLHITWRVISYWIWLAWEIVKANVDVARCILSPSLPISPKVTRVRASQRSAIGLVTYANSITLTPGTVSIEVENDTIVVHALTEAAEHALQEGEMDRRVSEMEGIT